MYLAEIGKWGSLMQLHTKNDAIAYFWRCNCIKTPKVTIEIIKKKRSLKGKVLRL